MKSNYVTGFSRLSYPVSKRQAEKWFVTNYARSVWDVAIHVHQNVTLIKIGTTSIFDAKNPVQRRVLKVRGYYWLGNSENNFFSQVIRALRITNVQGSVKSARKWLNAMFPCVVIP